MAAVRAGVANDPVTLLVDIGPFKVSHIGQLMAEERPLTKAH